MTENFFQKIKDEPLTKELAQRIIEETKGEARGMGFKADWNAVSQRVGPEGLKKLESKMEEVGFPLKYKDIKAMDFYPLGLDTISLLAIRDTFGFTEKDFMELGASAVKFSLFFKIVFRYFVSLHLIVKEASKLWRDHYTVGELKVPEINEKQKYVIVRIENFNIHHITCLILKGYLSKPIQMTLNRPVTCEETKCISWGDDYHEFLIKWT